MDGRRLRGERTRQAVAAKAAAVASVDGLAGMTLSQLADEMGVSKSSVQAAYGTKEELQLAAVAAATETFVREVVTPAQTADEGLSRLMALVDAWLDYVKRRVFPGGCFMVATLAEFDSRPGPVRDALAKARRGWLRVLEREAAVAQAAGDIPTTLTPELVAFEVDALLSAANIQRTLTGDTHHLAAVRSLIAVRLEQDASRRPSRSRQKRERSRP
jgi:AcrR family transcriptional regulator